jgi:hypothetical protein
LGGLPRREQVAPMGQRVPFFFKSNPRFTQVRL